jgi:hypothetical protein
MMKVLLRYSDGGSMEHKPSYVTKRGLLDHFLKTFEGYEIFIVADKVSDESFKYLSSKVQDDKHIQRTSYGCCPGSFMFGLMWMIQTLKDDDKLYMTEDDYMYTPDAPKVIEEGLDLADYVSGYDHPDKYENHSEGGPNPFVEQGGEPTRVLRGATRHWKITNSCCMTFAARIKTLKQDASLMYQFNRTMRSDDFHMFLALGKQGRRLISPLPGVSTHGERLLLSPFIDWETLYTQRC